MLGVEPLHLGQLDIGILGPVDGSTGNPPLRTGQACRQVCPSPGNMALLRPAALSGDLAVGRTPEGMP